MMAGDWIAIRKDLPRAIEVLRMVNMLKKTDGYRVAGQLADVWAWFDGETIDGVAHGVSPDFVDALVDQKGFADAMAATGWLIVTDEGLQVPKFGRWMGQSGKKRLRDNRRAAAEARRKKDDKKAKAAPKEGAAQYRTEHLKYNNQRKSKLPTTFADDL